MLDRGPLCLSGLDQGSRSCETRVRQDKKKKVVACVPGPGSVPCLSCRCCHGRESHAPIRPHATPKSRGDASPLGGSATVSGADARYFRRGNEQIRPKGSRTSLECCVVCVTVRGLPFSQLPVWLTGRDRFEQRQRPISAKHKPNSVPQKSLPSFPLVSDWSNSRSRD
jgi:hypothetical protein